MNLDSSPEAIVSAVAGGIFLATHFGATGNGQVNDAPALNAAITAAHQAGGGRVVVTPGTYRCGSIRLRSRVTLELLSGATLLASPDPRDFPECPWIPPRLHKPFARRLRHFLWADDEEDCSLLGQGRIEGDGARLDIGRKPYHWSRERPVRFEPMIEFRRCRRVLCDGLQLGGSPGWTIHCAECDQVRIHGVRIRNGLFAGQTDGIDLCGCRDVHISDCDIETGDDCIALKAPRESRSCERVVVTNCLLHSSCAALKIGTETWHDIRHLTYGNCVVHRSSRAFEALCFDGGTVEDVVVHDLVVDTDSSIPMNRPVHLDLCRRRVGLHADQSTESTPLGRMRRVVLSNLAIRTDGRLLFTAADGGYLESILLRGVLLQYPWIEDPRRVLSDADAMQTSNASPEARAARAALVCQGVRGLRVSDWRVVWPEGGAPPDSQAKYERGRFLYDPRTQESPGFAAFWGRDLVDCHVDWRGLAPSRPDLPLADLGEDRWSPSGTPARALHTVSGSRP